VSLEQGIQYLSAVASPLIGTSLANYIGLGGALWVSAGLRVAGFLLFLIPTRKQPNQGYPPPVPSTDALTKLPAIKVSEARGLAGEEEGGGVIPVASHPPVGAKHPPLG
jgi:hypothetical protein